MFKSQNAYFSSFSEYLRRKEIMLEEALLDQSVTLQLLSTSYIKISGKECNPGYLNPPSFKRLVARNSGRIEEFACEIDDDVRA